MSANNRIGYLEAAFTLASTASFNVGYLPPNAYVTDIKVLVTTAFTGGVLDVGDDTTANLFANDTDLSSTGAGSVTLTAQAGVVQSTSDQTLVTAIVVAGGTTFPAGAGKVVVEFAYVG